MRRSESNDVRVELPWFQKRDGSFVRFPYVNFSTSWSLLRNTHSLGLFLQFPIRDQALDDTMGVGEGTE